MKIGTGKITNSLNYFFLRKCVEISMENFYVDSKISTRIKAANSRQRKRHSS